MELWFYVDFISESWIKLPVKGGSCNNFESLSLMIPITTTTIIIMFKALRSFDRCSFESWGPWSSIKISMKKSIICPFQYPTNPPAHSIKRRFSWMLYSTQFIYDLREFFFFFFKRRKATAYTQTGMVSAHVPPIRF